MGERVFNTIFRESDEHVAKLCRVRVEAWWDGSLLLFIGEVARRHDSRHEWPEADEKRWNVSRADSLGEAVRAAVKLTDDFIAAMFKEDDAACKIE